jgi:glycosyltransferase involved in cell wall biosynthesis
MNKILVIGPLPPPTGGMQTVMEQMINLDIKRYELMPFNVSKNKIIKSNIFFNISNFIYRCLKLFAYILIYNPEIVHIHIAADKDIKQKRLFQNICKIFNKKTILHTHGSRFKEWYSGLNANEKKKVQKILNKADALIVLSDSWKKYYSTISHHKNIFVINNAIEDVDFKKYGRKYSKDEFIVLFLSHVCERKGVYDLLKAIKQVKDSKMKFVFVGPYENKDKFLKEVDNLGIKDRCVFVGEILGKERFKYFASADVFVLPSYAEGLPVAILEAMSFGLPIISTNVGAIPEVVNKENGIIVKPGDISALKNAILTVHKNKSINYYKNNISKIRKGYTQKIFIKHLVKVYESFK